MVSICFEMINVGSGCFSLLHSEPNHPPSLGEIYLMNFHYYRALKALNLYTIIVYILKADIMYLDTCY